jgi:hypothetical protein
MCQTYGTAVAFRAQPLPTIDRAAHVRHGACRTPQDGVRPGCDALERSAASGRFARSVGEGT